MLEIEYQFRMFSRWVREQKLRLMGVDRNFHCQREIEMESQCKHQCGHCKEYFAKPYNEGDDLKQNKDFTYVIKNFRTKVDNCVEHVFAEVHRKDDGLVCSSDLPWIFRAYGRVLDKIENVDQALGLLLDNIHHNQNALREYYSNEKPVYDVLYELADDVGTEEVFAMLYDVAKTRGEIHELKIAIKTFM